MMRQLATFLIAVVAVSIGASVARAQVSPAYYDYVRSDLDWYTIETEHFLVHFHADSTGGSGRTARVVSDVAEDAYGPITSLYDYEPDTKVSFILKDYEDYSNGAAYFFDNVIEIWAPALDTPLRGDHNWLRNVITHEFTHMVQVQKTMKTNRRLPFLYLQYLDYEDVRRPDVLYGFPNVVATYPVPILNNPAWLAEGTAQFQRDDLSYDRWDTHRDMLLRTQVLEGEELTLAEMGGFYSHNSLMRESVYNHGFAFTQFIAGRYGEEGLRDISTGLAEWGNFNFRQAAKDVFGIDGRDLYDEWMEELRAYYAAAVRPIERTEVTGRIVEPEGFFNFYPKISPDGRRIAYLSNQGRDFSATGLFVRELGPEDGSSAAAEPRRIGGPGMFGDGPSREYTCSMGHSVSLGHGFGAGAGPDALLSRAEGPISWHPDGDRILYVRTKDTPEGYLYADLYEIPVDGGDPERITTNRRAADPAYGPDGNVIVFVQQSDGTTNLVRLDRETGSETRLTEFVDGTQVHEPAVSPDGEWVYFGRSGSHGRDIARIPLEGGAVETVVATPADERSPAFDTEGRLVFSSDASGIFNLYRLESDGSQSALTNEIGGAFMPDPGPGGRLAYSVYSAQGYRIAMLDEIVALADPPQWEPPGMFFKVGDSPEPPAVIETTEGIVGAPDRVPAPQIYDARALNRADDTGTRFNDGADDVREYEQVFTSFSFLPVLRVDSYVSRQRSRTDVRLPDRTRAETLWRNTKLGFYTMSREVLGGLSMFGGILIGPGSGPAESFGDFLAPSNLLKLERDIFMQFDYARGLGLINRRWAPQLSLELFNVRRNVTGGLAIEEVRCTACYPDSTVADLAYNLWEMDLVARSKINRALLAEVGYRYSPYRVTTERFFSEELQQSIPENSSRYFIGRAVHARLYFEAFEAHRDSDVVPHGARIELGWDRESGRLLESFDLDDGILEPIYASETINRLSLAARVGVKLTSDDERGAHGVGLRLRSSTILGGPVDDFYDDYVGGLTGARGYPFYALGGNESIWLQASYSLPLVPRIGRQWGPVYLDKIYLRVYGDAAMAWSGDLPGLEQVRKDAGAEIRFGLGSYYLLPTALFVSGTYGFDAFDLRLDEGFVTPDGGNSVRYGEEFQWHVGLLFGFDQF